MLPMYDGIVNSPATELAAAIDATQTTITVVDGTKLPPAPNLATIGIGEDAETILYTAKDGNTLSGVTRGFQGTVKSWPARTPMARLFTEYDWHSVKENLNMHVGETILEGVHGGLPAHKSTHAIGGTDPLSPLDIGALVVMFNVPRITGRYYTTPGTNDGATAVVSANYLYTIPFYVIDDQESFDRIGIHVSTAATGSARLGIYRASTFLPDQRVLDAGSVDTSTTGAKEIAISLTLARGLYWLALLCNAAPYVAGMRCSGTPTIYGGSSPYFPFSNGIYYSITYNPLPSSLAGYTPSYLSSAGVLPLVFLRRA